MLRQTTATAETNVTPIPGLTSPEEAKAPSGAEQVRVTPEEFAQALAALDSRRMQTAHAASQTITIGDALEQLNVEATPEEVAAEVERLRAANASRQSVTSRPFQKQRNLSAQVAFGAAGVSLLLFSLGTALTFSVRHAPPPPQVVQAVTVAQVRLGPDQILAEQIEKDGAVVIKTLAEVGDNQAVSVRSNDVLQSANITLGDHTEANSLTERPARWSVIKHNGVAYVRGYLPAPLSPGALRLGNITIANRVQTPAGVRWGPTPTPIDVRMDKIVGVMDNMYMEGADGGYSISDKNWERITLSTVPSDAIYPSVTPP